MSDTPASILFDEFGSPITTVSGIDGVRIGVDADLDLSLLATEATASGIAQTVTSLDGKDFATETTLANLEAKDFATETTVATLGTEATLSGIAQTTTSLDGKDYSTETTLVSLEAKDFSTETTLSGLAVSATSLDGKDFATETTQATLATEAKLEAVRALLVTIDADTSNLDVALSTLATEAKLEAVRALLASLDAKDYATQTTLASILVDTGQLEALLTTIDADTSNLDVLLSTRATEATLAAADAKLATIDAVLDAIKDTTGVADLGKWLGSAAPTVGQKVMAASLPITLASDQPAIPVSSGAPAPSDSVREFCRNGGSREMNVDGSVTPVPFDFLADATDDIAVTEVRLVMVASAINMKGEDFGANIPLTNGMKLEATVNGSTAEFANFLVNEDFLAAPGDVRTIYDGPANDQVLASFNFGGALILKGGTSDRIRVAVRDDLTEASAHVIKVLWCVVFGRKI